MGIAVTDPLKIIASGLDTVDAQNIMSFLEGYFQKEEVECLVVGNPNSTGRGGDMTRFANDFCAKVKDRFPAMKIERVDEFYTSKIAQRTIIHSGINKMERRDKSLVDKISATIILQSYLELIKS